jgi:hypothetical protein
MEAIKKRINKIIKGLRGREGINIIVVNEYEGETNEQAVKRYKEAGEYKATSLPDVFIYVKSDEQVQREKFGK